MEEFRIGRFFRREVELQPGVRQVVWRQLRSERRRVPDIAPPRRGPYEMSYDVSRGYIAEEPA